MFTFVLGVFAGLAVTVVALALIRKFLKGHTFNEELSQSETTSSLEDDNELESIREETLQISDHVIAQCDIRQRVRSLVISDTGRVWATPNEYWMFLQGIHSANREEADVIVKINHLGELRSELHWSSAFGVGASLETLEGVHNSGDSAVVAPVTELQYNLLILAGDETQDTALRFLNQERKRFYNRNKKFMKIVDDWVARNPRYKVNLLSSSGAVEIDGAVEPPKKWFVEEELERMFDNDLLPPYSAGGKLISDYPLVQILSAYEQDGNLEISLISNYSVRFFLRLTPTQQ